MWQDKIRTTAKSRNGKKVGNASSHRHFSWGCGKTYVVEPCDSVLFWVRPDVAFKVDVVTFFYVFGIQRAAQMKRHLRWILNKIYN